MIATASLFLAMIAPQERVEFLHNASNLKFSHPATWKVKRVKDDFQITIPLPTAKEDARLDIYTVSFAAAPDVWENSQRYFAEQLKQTIKAKTREELLGVPLLLYKLQETETPARKITLAGMIYAATEFKFQFRLTASEAAFSEAEYEFRQALQSFATIDGKLPESERPGRTTEAPATGKKPFRVPEKTTTALGGPTKVEPAKLVIGESRLSLTVSGKSVELCAPTGWDLKANAEGVIIASIAGLTNSLEINLFSSLDSPKLSVALLRKTATLLDEFTVVKRRDESKPTDNLAGAKVTRIQRSGTGKSSDLTQWIAGGEKAEFYWIAVYRSTGSIDPAQSKLLDQFLAGASVELKP